MHRDNARQMVLEAEAQLSALRQKLIEEQLLETKEAGGQALAPPREGKEVRRSSGGLSSIPSASATAPIERKSAAKNLRRELEEASKRQQRLMELWEATQNVDKDIAVVLPSSASTQPSPENLLLNKKGGEAIIDIGASQPQAVMLGDGRSPARRTQP